MYALTAYECADLKDWKMTVKDTETRADRYAWISCCHKLFTVDRKSYEVCAATEIRLSFFIWNICQQIKTLFSWRGGLQIPVFFSRYFLCLSFGLMMVVKYLNRKQIDTTFTHGQKIFVVLALLIKNIIYMLNNLSEINNIDFVIHLFPTFACRVKLNMILEK